MREIHEPGVVRDAPGIVAGLLAVSVVAWHPQLSSVLLVLASCGLAALLALAQGNASDATRKALAARVKFDSESGSGYIKSFSAEIVQALS